MLPRGPAFPNLGCITPSHPESLGGGLFQSSWVGGSGGVTSANNQIMYYPFTLYEPAVAASMSVPIGTSSGNLDVGIYGRDKTRLWNAGSTAVAASNTLQTLTISGGLAMAPGGYYMAIQLSTTGCSTQGVMTVNDEQSQSLYHCPIESAGAMGLPATATFATETSSSVKIFHFSVNFN